jgi:hypothetical protein
MWLSELCQLWLARTPSRRSPTLRRRGVRLTLEQLEDRTVPANFTAASVSDLIADINAANAAGGANTIALVSGTTYNLTAADNATDGGNGLPVIAANDSLTILGNGDTVQRSAASGTPAFRLFDVASGASLALANLTLQGGYSVSVATVQASGRGGAVYNQGSLSLNGVTVQNDTAYGNAFGGGIFSSGSLVANSCIIQNNLALGFDARNGGIDGGSAYGGGLFLVGTASLTNITLTSNTVQGGRGGQGFAFSGERIYGNGGSAFGGGLYVGDPYLAATLDMHDCVVTGNSAIGGQPGGRKASKGVGDGGGLYIHVLASVCLDAFTVANATSNKVSTSGANIFGSYRTC